MIIHYSHLRVFLTILCLSVWTSSLQTFPWHLIGFHLLHLASAISTSIHGVVEHHLLFDSSMLRVTDLLTVSGVSVCQYGRTSVIRMYHVEGRLNGLIFKRSTYVCMSAPLSNNIYSYEWISNRIWSYANEEYKMNEMQLWVIVWLTGWLAD